LRSNGARACQQGQWAQGLQGAVITTTDGCGWTEDGLMAGRDGGHEILSKWLMLWM